MKLPRYLSPNAIPEGVTTLPSVSAVLAHGFLCQTAPVVRFGPAKDAMLFVLLSYGQRGYVARVIEGFDGYSTRLAPDYVASAILRPNGEAGRWHNAEHLWVAVPWLLVMEQHVGEHTNCSSLVFAMVRQAAKL